MARLAPSNQADKREQAIAKLTEMHALLHGNPSNYSTQELTLRVEYWLEVLWDEMVAGRMRQRCIPTSQASLQLHQEFAAETLALNPSS